MIGERLDVPLLNAVAQVLPGTRSIHLDFANQCVRVITASTPAPEDKDKALIAINNTLEHAFPRVAAALTLYREHRKATMDKWVAATGKAGGGGRRLADERHPWPIHFSRPHTYPFTLHVAARPERLAPFGKTHQIVVFDVPIASLRALQDAYAALLSQGRSYDYILTFALGGTSALIHVSQALLAEKGKSGLAFELALRQVKRQCHLFQGLNSAGGTAAQAAFTQWLENVTDKADVFIFDTGSSGNGARQILPLVRKTIRTARSCSLRRVHVQAIVDREEHKQRKESQRVVIGSACGMRRWLSCLLKLSRGHYVTLEIDYLHVPHMLTEDCEFLVGHDRNHEFGFIRPVKDSAIMRLLNHRNEPVEVLSTAAMAPALAALLEAPSRIHDLETRKVVDSQGFLSARCTLADAWKRETEELKVAARCGFFSAKEYRWWLCRLRRSFRAAIKYYPAATWDFEAKKLVRPKRTPPANRVTSIVSNGDNSARD